MNERSDPPPILASDAEREQSIVLLRDAVVEGRLTLEEFSDRVGRAQAARNDRELTALTVDLPALATAPVSQATPAQYRATFSKRVRRGAWDIPTQSNWRSLFGTLLSAVTVGAARGGRCR